MTNNYLFAEPFLIETLKKDVPELVDVANAATLGVLANENPVTPCAYVVYIGDAVNDDVSSTGGISRNAQYVTQVWSVVLCVSVTDGRGLGSGSGDAGGELIDKIFKSLCGHQITDVCKPITRHSTPVVTDYDDNGNCYFQLNFQIGFVANYK